MRISLILVVLGLVAFVAPTVTYVYQRQVHKGDVREVDQLRARLDSVRVALKHAATATDSSALGQQIRGQEEGLTRREYHLPHRQSRLDRWWRPTSPATVSIGLGIVLVVIGSVGLRRKQADTL